MKKILIVVFLCMLYIALCSRGRYKTEYYEERLSEYETIAKYALQNYSSPDESRVLVMLNDITDENLIQSVQIAKEKFDYIWIENNSVVFWDNEMKKLGLVYSEDVKKSIKKIEEWYAGLSEVKINNNCYLIGQLYAR